MRLCLAILFALVLAGCADWRKADEDYAHALHNATLPARPIPPSTRPQ